MTDPEQPSMPKGDMDERSPIVFKIVPTPGAEEEGPGQTEQQAREFLARKVNDEGISK